MKKSRLSIGFLACVILVAFNLPAARAADDGSKVTERKVLADHQTVAKLTGIAFQQCRGRTADCPDKCGHSGDFATFEIVAYISYTKAGQYGEDKQKTCVFQIEDNKKNLKVAKELAATVRDLKAGDYVLLNWSHDYVTKTWPEGGKASGPERPVAKVEKITKEQADKLIAAAASQPATSTAPADQGKTDPPGLPLKATLLGAKKTYAIPAGQSGEAFVKKLKDAAARPGNMPPAPPAVDMTLEITNTGDKAVTVPVGSDDSSIELKLEGHGAITIPFMQIHTMEMRGGKATTIAPGKSISFPIARLQFGQRGDSTGAYWTAPGEYTLTASYVTPVVGLDAVKVGQVTIMAAPVKIQITAPGQTPAGSQPTTTSKPVSGVPAAFDVKCRKADDRVAVSASEGKVVFTVTSPSGIGGATISHENEGWPKEVVVRLALGGMESLEVSCGEAAVKVEVSSHGEAAVSQHTMAAGKEGLALDKDSPLWLDVKVLDATGKATKGAPGKGGCFEVTLPKAMLESKSKVLKLSWVDFYR